jgi:hypothetical protein
VTHTVDWFNEDHDIVVVTYTGRWSWDEVREVDAKVRALYAQVSGRVDCICDMSNNAWVPPHFVENVNALTEMAYDNLHLTVFLAPHLLRELITAYHEAFRRLPYEFTFAKTIAEAFELILQSRGLL